MNRNELISVFKGAIAPDLTKFSQHDADQLVIEGILEQFGLKDASAREIRAKQPEVFALIEEVIEEMLPAAVEDVVGGFVETKTFARDAEVVFEIKGLGKARARQGIVEGARGGVYKARRLDEKMFQVPVKTETVAVYVTLEDILLGRYTLADLMANIRDGFVERIYIKAVQALRTAKALAPAANIAQGNGIDNATLDRLINIAKQYGNPVIMGFRGVVAKINNGASWTNVPNIAMADLDEVRSRGVVTIYHGVPVVELPNYLVDENNAEFMFKEGDLFILPGDARPVKVAFKGDLYIQENQHPTGSKEQQAHRMLGVGLMLANNVCVYTDNDVTGGQF